MVRWLVGMTPRDPWGKRRGGKVVDVTTGGRRGILDFSFARNGRASLPCLGAQSIGKSRGSEKAPERRATDQQNGKHRAYQRYQAKTKN